MKKQLLKIGSAILSVTMLMSSLTLFNTSATEVTSPAELPTTAETNDLMQYATGNNSALEETFENATKISSVEDYYSVATPNNSKSKLRSSRAVSFPSSVDNSQSIYFPKIGNQESLGSCNAWSQVYYQFTYTMNKSLGVATTEENTFSPKFAYNYLNGGKDSGSVAEYIYDFMKYQGNVPLSLVPYDDDYLTWSPTEEIWKTSIKYRVKDYQIFDIVGSIETPVTSPDDSDLDAIKTSLNNGDILAASTLAYSLKTTTLKENADAPENSNHINELVVTKQSGIQGGHRLTIVGYNDNIWTDINKNNKVDNGEMGAFKVANSWGTNYGNDGFVWFSYDSINRVSSVEGVEADSSRDRALTSIARIDVEPYNSEGDLYFKYTLNTSNRNTVKAEVTAELNGTVYTAPIYTNFTTGVSRGEFSYDGTKNSNDGTMILSLYNVLPQITSENLADCNWKVTFYDTKSDSVSLTVKDAEIVDTNTNKVFKPNNAFPFTLNGTEKTVELIESQSNNVVVYYRGYDTPNLHYKVNNGEWQSVPMTENIERRNYVNKHIIELDTASTVTMYFSDNDGNIDNNNGKYYTATKGLNYFVTENVAQPLVAKIHELPDTAYDVGQPTLHNGEATGGYEPYQYQFVYTNLDTGKVSEYKYFDKSDSSNTYYRFETEGNYRITINVKDYSDKVASDSIDVYVKDRDFTFSQLNLKQGDTVVAGQPVDIYAETRFENIISRGNVFSMYDITVKKDNKTYFTTNIRATTGNTRTRTSTIDQKYTPYETGTYTVSISSTDGNDQYAEKFYTFKVVDHLYGDVDCNTKINVRDATLLQMYIANYVSEDDISLIASDVNKDNDIAISDATNIQLSIANLSSSNYVGHIIPIEIPEIPTTPPTEPTTKPSTNSNKVYFTNSHKWSGTISCYYWSDSNKSMTSWPGKAMALSETNQYGESVYTFDVPSGATYIIFTNGSSQTVDISYNGGVVKYYPLSTTDSQGHYKVQTWT